MRHERVEEAAFLASLPTGSSGREETLVWLVAGDHGVLVESLFVRRPVRRSDTVHAALLGRNARTRTVAFALDPIGDVYLLGIVPLAALLADPAGEVDAVLGQVFAHDEEAWRQVVEVGFGPLEQDPGMAKWAEAGAGRHASGSPLDVPAADPRR